MNMKAMKSKTDDDLRYKVSEYEIKNKVLED